MKNTATIGIAALLAGAAGGYLAGKAGSSEDSAKTKAEEVMNAKTQARPGSSSATEAGKRERNMDQILREPGQLARM